MERNEQLTKIRDYVMQQFRDDATGHDFFHMKRVARIARIIAEAEQADLFICEVAGWLHDIGDPKIFVDPAKAYKELVLFLHSIDITPGEYEQILKASKDVSFRKGATPETLEGKIVQDADRIDAIGAIGIARTFAYGGAKDQLIYHDKHREHTSIQHFYEKLLKLKGSMHTETAKQMAMERHMFMVNYLEHFFAEW